MGNRLNTAQIQFLIILQNSNLSNIDIYNPICYTQQRKEVLPMGKEQELGPDASTIEGKRKTSRILYDNHQALQAEVEAEIKSFEATVGSSLEINQIQALIARAQALAPKASRLDALPGLIAAVNTAGLENGRYAVVSVPNGIMEFTPEVQDWIWYFEGRLDKAIKAQQEVERKIRMDAYNKFWGLANFIDSTFKNEYLADQAKTAFAVSIWIVEKLPQLAKTSEDDRPKRKLAEIYLIVSNLGLDAAIKRQLFDDLQALEPDGHKEG